MIKKRKCGFCSPSEMVFPVSIIGIVLSISLVFVAPNYGRNLIDSLPRPRHGNTYVIAHRGAHQFAPENSLLAYRSAIDMGCDFVEIDVRKCKDGHFVSIHNAKVDAYFKDKTGEVNDFTLAELRQIPLGKNNEDVPQEFIPTLEEILKLCKGRIGIYLDLKEPDIQNQVQIIRRFGMSQDVVWYIPASYMEAIRQLKLYCKECIVMPDPGPERNLIRVIDKVSPIVIASDMDQLSAGFVQEAHGRGVKVFVDDKKTTQEEWRQIIDWGTDGIQTDNPEELIEFIKANDK